MKGKSLQQIHQQALNLLSKLINTGKQHRVERVILAHNLYVDNACANLGVAGMHRLTDIELETPLDRSTYLLAPSRAVNNGDGWD